MMEPVVTIVVPFGDALVPVMITDDSCGRRTS